MSNPLKKAIDAGDVERIKRLIESDPTLSTKPILWGSWFKKCQTEPLHYLSDGPFHQLWTHRQQGTIARVLLEAGAPPDGLSSSGETPLHGAASLGEVQVAQALIDFGADLEKRARYPGIPDGTPLDFAVHFGMVEIIDLLVSRGAKILSARIAAGAGLLEPLQRLLSDNNKIDAFRCACVCDRVEVVQFLLDSGLEVQCDIDGASGLHWAAWEGKPKMVQYLVDHGASIDLKDSKHHLTPAGWASHRKKELKKPWGHSEVLGILSAT